MFKTLFSKVKESYYSSRAWVLRKQIERYQKEDAEQEKLLKQIQELRKQIEQKRSYKENQQKQALAEKESLVEGRFIHQAFKKLNSGGINKLDVVERIKVANTLKKAADELEKNHKHTEQLEVDQRKMMDNQTISSTDDVKEVNKTLDEVTKFEYMKKIYALEGEINKLNEENRRLNEKLNERQFYEQEQSRKKNITNESIAFTLGSTLVVMQDPSNDSEHSFGGILQGYLYDDNNQITEYLIRDPQGGLHAVSKELENDTLVKVPEGITLEAALNNINSFLDNQEQVKESNIQKSQNDVELNNISEKIPESEPLVNQKEPQPNLKKINNWQVDDYVYVANLKNQQGLVPAQTILLFEDEPGSKNFGVVLGTKENADHELITAVQMVENLENGENNLVYLTQDQMKNPNILVYEDQNRFIDSNANINMEKLGQYQAQKSIPLYENSLEPMNNHEALEISNEPIKKTSPVLEMER